MWITDTQQQAIKKKMENQHYQSSFKTWCLSNLFSGGVFMSEGAHWSADDIEIIFRRGSWKANGEFAQTDVHRQIAIVFKTPPYQDPDITEEVEVNISLRRLSDQMESEPITFTYLPKNPGQSGLQHTALVELVTAAHCQKGCI